MVAMFFHVQMDWTLRQILSPTLPTDLMQNSPKSPQDLVRTNHDSLRTTEDSVNETWFVLGYSISGPGLMAGFGVGVAKVSSSEETFSPPLLELCPDGGRNEAP